MLLPKAAEATSIVESTDFSDNFAGRDSLAAGVDSVQGTVTISEGGFDPADYFVFTSLQPGATFTLQLTYVSSSQANDFGNSETLEWRLEPTGTLLNSTTVSTIGGTGSFMGVVAANGDIAADVTLPSNANHQATYRVDLTVQPLQNGNGVPETGGTMMLMGAAVAGLALAKKLKRRRKKA